jgi:hypothetical protein
VPWDDLSQWDSALAHGGKGDGSTDDTAAIQAAIDSGATTVYLPNTKADGVTGANWLIKNPLYLRGKVRRFIGTEGKLTASGNGQLIVQDGTNPVVVMERIESSVPTVQGTARSFVISSCNFGTYTNTVSGTVFFDDVVSGVVGLNHQTAFARQLDQETGPVSQSDQTSVVKVLNNGGTLWVLGLKTERGAVCIQTTGGKTELLGAHIYATGSSITNKTTAIFADIESQVSLTARETCYNNGLQFPRGVDETRNGMVRSIGPAGTGAGSTYVYSSGTGGEMFTLYVSQPVPGISTASVSGGSFLLSGTNGLVGAGYVIMSSTNLGLPPASWTPVLTNTFGVGGSFSNAIRANSAAQMFYRLKLQ